MTTDTEHLRKWVRHNLVLFLLGCFLLIDVLSISTLLENQQLNPRMDVVKEMTLSGDDAFEQVPKISDIRGPRIDTEAASVIVETREGPLPAHIFVFLLFAYAALLVFSLVYDFERTVEIRWGWESMLTGFALLAWFVWGSTAATLWYPLTVLKTGLLIYAVYLYFYDRRMLRRSLEEERIFVDEN